MGDMREIYDAMKAAKKKRKADRLESANDENWSKHTPYHWFMEVDGGRLNYWPSTGLCMINGNRHNIKSKFIKNLINTRN